jgi:hypothetical protein
LNITTNSGQAGLTWSAVTNATGYNVKRAITSGVETPSRATHGDQRQWHKWSAPKLYFT